MKDILKRWSIYITIFVVSVLLTDQYREYRQLQEFEAVRKDLIRQEQEAVKDQERKCLKNALWYEAGNQSLYGIQAVATVIQNRKNHPDYPDTYCGVIHQHKQFSYTLLKKPDVEIIKTNFIPMEAKAYANVEEVADKVISGEFQPVLDRSVRFYAATYVKNYWTKTKKVAAKIGGHIFYKDKEK
jgi:spore germination cell wall hydrolase CwlJ-like protein